MGACSLLVNLRKGMQSSSEQPLVGEERYVTTLITAAKETTLPSSCSSSFWYRDCVTVSSFVVLGSQRFSKTKLNTDSNASRYNSKRKYQINFARKLESH